MAVELPRTSKGRQVTRQSPGIVACAGLAIVLTALVFGVATDQSGVRPRKMPHDNDIFSAEQLRLLRWFDQLRFPPVEKLRFVQWDEGGRFAFMVAKRDATFEIGKDELSVVFRYLEDIVPRDVDLLQRAREILADARKMGVIKDDSSPAGGGTFPHQTSRLFLWAWVCWRSGQSLLAEQLLTESQRLYARNPQQLNRWSPDAKFVNQFEFLESEFGYLKWHNLLNCFEDLSLSRGELLAESQWFVDHFPNSRHREWAVDFARELKRMLAEEELHARSARPFDQLHRQQQIAELIFQLRDQTGFRGWTGNFADIFNSHYSSDGTPARRLVKHGHDAVPQLIEALGNKRVTRTCGYLYTYTGEVVRIGGCAQAILERISGRSFSPTEEYDPETKTRTTTVTVADQYRDWYTMLQQKGEQQLLIEGTELGDSGSAPQAEQLVDKYPNVAVRAIHNGILRSKEEPEITASLIALLGRVPGDEAITELRDHVENAPFQLCRITAAKALSRRGRDEGMRAMLTEWAGERIPCATDREESEYDLTRCAENDECLATFLFQCGRVEAIKALQQGIRGLPAYRRNKIVRDIFLDSTMIGVLKESEPYPPDWLADFPHRDPLPDRLAAMEELFVLLLDDPKILQGWTIGRSEIRGGAGRYLSLVNPRVCDVAALELHDLFPDRYGFADVATYEAHRKQDFLKLKNTWRAAHGRELLLEPKP